jgi:pyruvate/2-oxoacid:ferredoxin oxidoreductase alpha subunit
MVEKRNFSKKVISGNYAVSYGVMLSEVEVISAYPITPQTTIVELLSEMVASGNLNAEFIKVESEHSALSAVMGASAAGVRVFTATSSQGLALMHEMIHWTVGARLPVIIANVNRALAPPWSIWTEQTDSLAQRDTGIMQFYLESNQEVLDYVIIAYKIAEKVHLPAMIVLEAFILSHTYEPVEIYNKGIVQEFLPKRKPLYVVEPMQNSFAVGALGDASVYMEWRYKIQIAMEKAMEVLEEELPIFNTLFGRNYDILEEFYLDDADVVVISAGAMSSNVKYAVREYRDKKSVNVGMLRIIVFRPFPANRIRKILSGRKKVIVIDRNISFGAGGIFAQEVRNALYSMENKPIIYSYIMGLGGKDIMPDDVFSVIDEVLSSECAPLNSVWKGIGNE